jgi:hypothetical protein
VYAPQQVLKGDLVRRLLQFLALFPGALRSIRIQEHPERRVHHDLRDARHQRMQQLAEDPEPRAIEPARTITLAIMSAAYRTQAATL